jgi:hypothetical protein
MKKVKYSFSLDVHKQGIQHVISAKQNEKFSREIEVTLRENGKAFPLSAEVTAVVNVEKPDGNFAYNGCTIDGECIRYTITSQNLAVVGRATFEINILGFVPLTEKPDDFNENYSAYFALVDGMYEAYPDSDFISGEVYAQYALYAPAFAVDVSRNLTNEESVKSQNEYSALEAALTVVKSKYPGRWFFGTEITGTGSAHVADAKLNDCYMNNNTGDVFSMTEQDFWTYQGTLIGPQGEQGEPGPEGPKGDSVVPVTQEELDELIASGEIDEEGTVYLVIDNETLPQIQEDIENLKKNEGGGTSVGFDLLWENASPISGFRAQELTFNLTGKNYNFYLVDFINAIDGVEENRAADGIFTKLFWLNSESISIGQDGAKRSGNITDTLHYFLVTFSDCTVQGTVNNDFVIPYRIYGVRW